MLISCLLAALVALCLTQTIFMALAAWAVLVMCRGERTGGRARRPRAKERDAR